MNEHAAVVFGRGEFFDATNRIHDDVLLGEAKLHEFVPDLLAAVLSQLLVVFLGGGGAVAGTSQVDLVAFFFGNFGDLSKVDEISAISDLIGVSVEEDGERILGGRRCRKEPGHCQLRVRRFWPGGP